MTAEEKVYSVPLNRQFKYCESNGINAFAVNSPNFYDAISLSFIKQAHRNSLLYDNYACEWIPGIENVGSRVEATVSGNDQPVRFPIQTYSELSLNYAKSLASDVYKNSVMNTYSSQNGCWAALVLAILLLLL